MMQIIDSKQFCKSFFHIFLIAAVLIIGFIPLYTQPVHAAGNTYYVAKNGSNSNPGTSTQPWLTIQYAANKVVAGDTVYVRGGTYNEQVFISRKSGTPSAWITFKAYPGERVVIDGKGLTLNTPKSLVEIYQSDYIDFEGFEICNAGKSGLGAGLYVFNDDIAHSGYILKDLIIHDCYGTGILLAQTFNWYPKTRMENVKVDHCIIYNVNTGTGFEESYSNPALSCTSIGNFEIKNCVIHDVATNYTSGKFGQEALVVRINSANGSIHDNEFYNTKIGIYLNSSTSPINNIDIYNNKIHNNREWGIALGSEKSPYSAITNLDIYNNLIYNNGAYPGNGGFGIMSYSFNKTFNFINNTLYNNGTKEEIAILDAGRYQQGCVIRNNLIVGQGNTNYIRYADYPAGVTIDHNLFYNTTYGTKTYECYAGSIRFGTNYVIANPLLISPVTDFNLQSSSPAINMGASYLAPLTDYSGISRPQGSGIDIGADEYTTVIPSQTPQTSQVYASCLNNNSSTSLFSYMWLGQTFTPTSTNTLTSISLNIRKVGNPSGSAIVSIYATNGGVPTGSPLTSTSIAASSISGSYSWVNFNFSGGKILQAGNTYCWVLSLPSGNSSNCIYMQMDTTGSYPSGKMYKTDNGGSSWRSIFSGTADFVFKEIGVAY